jgi:hypothetical protein
MPLRRHHQVTLAGETNGGGLSAVRRIITMSRSPEDAPQVIDLHESNRH